MTPVGRSKKAHAVERDAVGQLKIELSDKPHRPAARIGGGLHVEDLHPLGRRSATDRWAPIEVWGVSQQTIGDDGPKKLVGIYDVIDACGPAQRGEAPLAHVLALLRWRLEDDVECNRLSAKHALCGDLADVLAVNLGHRRTEDSDPVEVELCPSLASKLLVYGFSDEIGDSAIDAEHVTDVTQLPGRRFRTDLFDKANTPATVVVCNGSFGDEHGRRIHKSCGRPPARPEWCD